MVQTFNDAVKNVARRQDALNASASNARDSIEKLKQTVAEARENVNRYVS